jgi:hypothetical protein
MVRNEQTSPHEPEGNSTPQELARRYKLSVKTVQRLFAGEVGALRIRARGDEARRPRYTLRVPASVERRVMQRLSIKPGKAA